MDHQVPRPQGGRETFLGVLLSVIVVSGFLFLLFLICGGLSLYVLAVVGGMAAFGFLHYLLWGHSLSEEVADERLNEELGEDFEFGEWPLEGPHEPPRRF
jgi:hypothetical protein